MIEDDPYIGGALDPVVAAAAGDAGVERSLGDPGETQRQRVRARHDGKRRRDGLQPFEKSSRRGDARLRKLSAGRGRDRRAVAGGAVASDGKKELVADRRVKASRDRPAVLDQRGGHRPIRQARDIGARAVNWIDDTIMSSKSTWARRSWAQKLALKLSAGKVSGIPVSMGNPHYVMLVPEFSPNWQHEAAEIQRSGEFKRGVNVVLVAVDGRHDVRARFFERGAERRNPPAPVPAQRQWQRSWPAWPNRRCACILRVGYKRCV